MRLHFYVDALDKFLVHQIEAASLNQVWKQRVPSIVLLFALEMQILTQRPPNSQLQVRLH